MTFVLLGVRKIAQLSLEFQNHSLSPFSTDAWGEQLSSALVSLGFSPKESDNAISAVVADLQGDGIDPTGVELSELLKRTLASGKSSRG